MPLAPDPGPDFDALLDFLRLERNSDLTGYKRAGLARRVEKRMRAVGVQGFGAYRDYLHEHPDEFAQLFNTLLINVTAFFRDEQPWDLLRDDVVPRLLAAKNAADPIRVWCAGCATGQEAYTLAIVLAEALGDEQFRDRVKIYATDIDDDALAVARQGAYAERDVAAVPEALRERYFEQQDQRFVFRKDLRRLVIFGRNDLMQDAPISRIDLLTCRNALMYFDARTQARVLAHFHFALTDGGVLVLGRAETLLTHNNLFVPLDLRQRVFVKAPRPSPRELPRSSAAIDGRDAPGDSGARAHEAELREAAFDTAIVAQFIVDRGGRVAAINDRARALLQLGSADLGRPLQDLQVSYRPFELRSLIDQAYAELRPVSRVEVPWRAIGGEARWFDIVVTPLILTEADPDALPAPPARASGVAITFAEVTRHRQLQQQLQESEVELEAAYQELQSTNEELETTNEELHSTVEELETTNEELQSTNEELETMNEELQSTNEEVQSVNDEFRVRSDELNRLNAFLESVFTSLRAGVAVLDRELCVLIWNSRAEDLWGLRADEVTGQHFFNLDVGLPVARLLEPVRATLAGIGQGRQLSLDAVNRRGRAITCRVNLLPLIRRDAPGPGGVIVLMQEAGDVSDPSSLERGENTDVGLAGAGLLDESAADR